MSLTAYKKGQYVPSHILYGGDEDWNVLQPKKLIELLVSGYIREWIENENISLNQVYNAHVTKSIINKYEWLYCIYYCQEQLNGLIVGDEIDFRAFDGIYILVTITHRDGTKLSLNSMLNDKCQWTIDYKKYVTTEPKKFAKPRSITKNRNFTSSRFYTPCCGDYIFVKPWNKNVWKLGEVIEVKKNSKQRSVYIQINYSGSPWWAHLYDHEEVDQYMDQPKVWQIAFDSKHETRRYGPFRADQLRFIYHNNRYNLFDALFECKEEMKIKRTDDDDWMNVDETDIYLLLSIKKNSEYCYLCSIEKNKIKQWLQIKIKQNGMLWMYRSGPYGSNINGLYSREEMISYYYTKQWQNKSIIFIKRVAEKEWYELNDSDIRILFYHLSLHKDIEIPLGINNVAERMKKAHTNCLTPYIEYNEWRFIHNLMNNMEVGAYYGELEKLGFENTDSMIKDLETFIFSGDDCPNGSGSKIMQHFSGCIDDKEKWIKVGYIIFQSCKLMPALKSWTDLLNADYLEKNFSYLPCPDHVNICCCIVQRLMPLNKFTYLYNHDICYIPGQINNASIYWITCSAFINSLPHYNIDLFNKDWKHFEQCMETQFGEFEVDHYEMKNNNDKDEIAEVNLLKIFSFFTQNIVDINCYVEDCHTMNRKCFPTKSDKPLPISHEYGDGDRRKVESEIIDKLDSLHNMVHHVSLFWGISGIKFKLESGIMDENEYEILRAFIKTRKSANEKYKNIIKQPTHYYHEDNIVGWKGIKNVVIKNEHVVIKNIIAELRCESFEEMDICLDRYYKLCGINNYFNHENEGKLSLWADHSGYQFDDIIDEFEANAEDCMLLEFDSHDNGQNNFPFIDQAINDETLRNLEIFKIMNNCFKYKNAYQHGMDLINDDGVFDDLCVALCTLHK